MDVTKYLDLKPAPRGVFDALPERRARVRFMVPDPVHEWRAVTYGAFAREIRELALFLQGAGLRAADRAAVLAHNRVEWMSAALAIESAGGTMVPVYPSSTDEQVAYVIAHSDAKVVFVDGAAQLAKLFTRWSELEQVTRIVLLDDALDAARVLQRVRDEGKAAPQFSDVEPRILSLSRARALGRAADAEDGRRFEQLLDSVSLDQPAVMLYTSGTSGPPKGVPLTHRNTAVNGRDWLEVLAPLLDEGMTDLLWLPMSHIFGFGEACIGSTLGWTTYLVDPATVMAGLPEVRPDVLFSVPTIWEKLATAAAAEPTPERRKAKLDESTGGRLRFCLSGGAGLKREVKELFHATGLLIVEGYGLTEASPTLTMNRPSSFRFDSVGKPFPSVQLVLAEDGEILAKGPSIFGGYHKDPVATQAAFTEDGWLKTGDVGVLTDDGFLRIVDRKKDILVTAGGKNVPPANIEQRFADDPYLAHVVVYGDDKKYLVAGVWLNAAAVSAHLDAAGVPAGARKAATDALVQQRIERVNAALASYETIKKFVVVDTPLTVDGGLLTPTLKVKRKKVYEAFGAALEALYAEPRTS